MSTSIKTARVTVPEIKSRKGREPVVCLTAYTTPMARLMDAHVDLLLVGNSLGMVLYGLPSTLQVTLDMMIAHTGAVMRGSDKACVILDMPFGTYQESPQQAFRSAARALQETGCSGVKIEGGIEMADTIRFLTERGIPVMAHVGLMPQSINVSGGYRVRGRTNADAVRVIDDAKAVSQAGAFSVVVEGVVETVARSLTTAVDIPTIGIGASVACDGQVLVSDDMLGLFADFKPKFVKRYAELGVEAEAAVKAFAADVRAGRFPGPEHTFSAPKEQTDPAKKQGRG